MDRIISNNPRIGDDIMKEFLAPLAARNEEMSQKIFSVLCSQQLCRPKTLRFLIKHYKKTHPRCLKDVWKRLMSDALRSFVQEIRDCPYENKRKVIEILFQNGADPFEKSKFNRDAFQYAFLSGDTYILDLLLRMSGRNPIRRINQLINYESRILNRPEIVSYLNRTRRYYEDQGSYERFRIKTVLGTHRPTNV